MTVTDNGRRPGERKEAILDAAAALFAETGTRGTSIATVAAKAGVTDAGVLYHFNTKRELVLAVLERFDRDVERGLRDSDLRGIDLLRSVRNWGDALEQVPEIQAMLIVLSAEHLHKPGPERDYLQRRYERILKRFERAFREAVEAGDLRADLDPAFEASALVAHLDGIRMQWFMLDRKVSLADSVRTYLDQVFTRLAP